MGTEETFSDRLAWLLTASKCGSRELGQLAGISEGYASVVLGRGSNGPTIDVLNKIAGVFDIPVLWLGLGEGPRPRVAEIKEALDRARGKAA